VVKGYFLPIFGAVGTCNSAELLASPARDLMTYRRALLFRRHYVVSGGVSVIRQRLLRGVLIRLNRHVNRVRKVTRGLSVSWYGDGGKGEVADAVIFAIPPDAIAGIYAPLAPSLSQIPTVKVTVYAHTDGTVLTPSYARLSQPFGRAKDHVAIQLTTTKTHTSATEVHAGVMVSTTPQLVPGNDKVVMRAGYTRVLRTPESRRIVNALLNGEGEGWSNGDGGVWIVGGWCWDGMVLLEGCVRSAVRVWEEGFGGGIEVLGRVGSSGESLVE